MLRILLLLSSLLLTTNSAHAQGRASGHNPMGDTDAPNAYENLQYGTAGTDAELRRNPFSGDFDLTALMRSPRMFASSYRAAQDLAECIVERDAEAADILTEDTSTEALGALVDRHRAACNLSRSHALTVDMIDGALAETLLERSGKRHADRAMSVNVDEAEQFTGLVPGAEIDFAMIGRCVAVYSPGMAEKLIATTAGSETEAETLAGLYRATPECGLSDAPDGVPEVYQRSAIASGLYRWAARGN